jgi:hypothetical protein
MYGCVYIQLLRFSPCTAAPRLSPGYKVRDSTAAAPDDAPRQRPVVVALVQNNCGKLPAPLVGGPRYSTVD